MGFCLGWAWAWRSEPDAHWPRGHGAEGACRPQDPGPRSREHGCLSHASAGESPLSQAVWPCTHNQLQLPHVRSVYIFCKTVRNAGKCVQNRAFFSNSKGGVEKREKEIGLVRDLNPGPLAPKARIIPLDQRATVKVKRRACLWILLLRQQLAAWLLWTSIFCVEVYLWFCLAVLYEVSRLTLPSLILLHLRPGPLQTPDGVRRGSFSRR